MNRVRSVRSDAAHNRETILRSARLELGRHGLGIPLSQIIKATGLGRATFYRNFPTRDDLLRSIFDDMLARLDDVKAAAAPEHALFDIIRAFASLEETALPVGAALQTEGAPEIVEAIMAAFGSLVAAPLAAAKAAGQVRGDLSEDDLAIIFNMVGGATAFRPGAGTKQRRDRALEFAFDAIRPPG